MISLAVIDDEIKKVIAHGDNRNDIAYLANLYICRDRLSDHGETIDTESKSEFAVCINGKCFNEILPVIEELLDAVNAINPRLYRSFMSRLL